MQIEKIEESIKELTPDEKLKIIEPLLKKEKDKKKKATLFKIITKIKEEQRLIEENLQRLVEKPKKEENPRAHLETLVEEEAQKMPKEETKLKPYGADIKPGRVYGIAQQEGPVYEQNKKNQPPQYTQKPVGLTSESEQNLIKSDSHRLQEDRKKYKK